MKRSSPEGSDENDDDIETKKKRLCEFEAIRLCSITGVNDIEEKKSRVQVYKLSETLRFKDKIIAERDKEIERLRHRQYTDESTSYTINRYWNNLDEQLRNILLRGSNPSDVQNLLESNGDVSSSFLEEVVQLNEEERQSAYEDRVDTSVRLVQHILQSISQRAEQLKTFSGKLNSYMTESGSREDAFNETVHTNGILSDENVRLTKDISKIQNKYADVKLKVPFCVPEMGGNFQFREAKDKITILETQNEERLKEINDLKHDLDKAKRFANKLDFKLYTEIRERRKKTTSTSETMEESQRLNGTTGSPGDAQLDSDNNGCNSKLFEDLRLEVDSATELATARLNEINTLNEKLRKQAEELERSKLLRGGVENELDSKQVAELKMHLSMMMEENRKKAVAESSLLEEMDIMRTEFESFENTLKQNHERTVKKLTDTIGRLSEENETLKKELDEAKNDYEMTVKSIVSSGTVENKELRALRDAYRTQISQLKSEATRMRRKWKDSVNTLINKSKDLEVERKKNEQFYLVPIEFDDDDDLLSEDIEEKELRDRLLKLRKDNISLRQELDRIRAMDEKARDAKIEGDVKAVLDKKDREIAHLNTQLEAQKQGDESINQEMESIGQALEDLQEQNQELVRRAAHHDEEKIKMMGDKIASSQMEAKMKEEKYQLEQKIENMKYQIQTSLTERQHLEDCHKAHNALANCKSKEISSLRTAYEVLRKQTLEKAVELSQLKADKEKLSAQVKSVQDTVISKSHQYEISTQKVRRLDEENSLIKKKLDTLKRCEKLGSTDAVLNEEIRILKEALTCPSCKVNRKDAILTKCFHVFCMDCLKTRYDTRQRKCPKCNAGFGANDFQRAYIG